MEKHTQRKRINRALYVIECPHCNAHIASAMEWDLLPAWAICDKCEEKKKQPQKSNNMKLTKELDIHRFEPWSGAIDTYERLDKEDKLDEFVAWLEDIYPEGIDETHLNDILWFEAEWIFESLGISDAKEEEEEIDEDDDDDDDEIDEEIGEEI